MTVATENEKMVHTVNYIRLACSESKPLWDNIAGRYVFSAGDCGQAIYCREYGLYRICDKVLLAFAKVHTRYGVTWKEFQKVVGQLELLRRI